LQCDRFRGAEFTVFVNVGVGKALIEFEHFSRPEGCTYAGYILIIVIVRLIILYATVMLNVVCFLKYI
jgi:hypothetical protein